MTPAQQEGGSTPAGGLPRKLRLLVEANGGTLGNRCGNCLEPHRAHNPRMSGAPNCPTGGGRYREGTEAELSAAYDAAFPEGPKPIATFHTDSPEDMERARAVLSPEALNGFFGPGGGGMAAFTAAMEGRSA